MSACRHTAIALLLATGLPSLLAAQEPRTPIPPLTDADRQAALPLAMSGMHMEDETGLNSYTLVKQLEAWDADPGTGLGWEGEGWIGGDIHRLWWRTDGERIAGRTEAATVQALYGQSFTPWWDWVAGVRQDFEPGRARTFAAFGVQGLAPQRFEVAATGYVGEGGRTAARFEVGYDLLFTNRLVLQPLLEANLYGKDDAVNDIGAGLATAEAGLRLRYEITRQFAPYLGFAYERAFGNTANLRRAAGESAGDARISAGLRLWF